jgi:hypothetical protein
MGLPSLVASARTGRHCGGLSRRGTRLLCPVPGRGATRWCTEIIPHGCPRLQRFDHREAGDEPSAPLLRLARSSRDGEALLRGFRADRNWSSPRSWATSEDWGDAEAPDPNRCPLHLSVTSAMHANTDGARPRQSGGTETAQLIVGVSRGPDGCANPTKYQILGSRGCELLFPGRNHNRVTTAGLYSWWSRRRHLPRGSKPFGESKGRLLQ